MSRARVCSVAPGLHRTDFDWTGELRIVVGNHVKMNGVELLGFVQPINRRAKRCVIATRDSRSITQELSSPVVDILTPTRPEQIRVVVV